MHKNVKPEFTKYTGNLYIYGFFVAFKLMYVKKQNHDWILGFTWNLDN